MGQVIRKIIPLAQKPGSNHCWAAVTAMMLGKSGPTAIDEVIVDAKLYKVPLQADDRLDPQTGVGALARAFGFTFDSVPALGGRQQIHDALQRGVCGLFGQARFSWGKTEGHAVAIHGMVIDDKTGNTRILGVDSRGYRSINMTAEEFYAAFSPDWIMYKAL